MKVVGFTFIRNAIQFDYPIVEAVRSILPLCDEVVVAVGRSDDETLALVQSIDSEKIRIIETVWDDTLRTNGAVLAVETNKAFDAVGADADWCFYIQGDECLHEKFLPTVKAAMEKWKDDPHTEGLLFKYTHFYGSYDYIATSRKWYRHEIRIIKNDKSIRSYRDAQGFRKNGQKLKVREVAACIYHYGWVKPPQAQQLKQVSMNKLWHSDEVVKQKIPDVESFDYTHIDDLERFDGSHPAVMQRRIQALNWTFSFDPTKRKLSMKEQFSRFIERCTGWRIGEYKNYEKKAEA
ncbi:MAG: glycosyltransferase family 2 protein [Saprospiraceae bacterium]|nr:glycosyltransferase family 2 protein [Saprospiraceae bacterium]